MKKFIKQTVTLISIAILLIVSIVFATNYTIRSCSMFKISPEADKIILGHSHPQCALNDSLIKNCVNFSNSGESYLYTYFKAIELIKQNKQIKTVFLEFTNNQISKEMDDWFFGQMYMTHSYPVYAPFMDKEANKLLLKNNPNVFYSSTALLIKNNLATIAGSFDYTKKIGKYLYLPESKVDSILRFNKNNKKADTTDYDYVSKCNINYLEKIIEYCKKENVKVYLIRSPLNKNYIFLKNEVNFQKVLRTNFLDVEFLDFKNFPLINSEFSDLAHLNYKGAKRFSIFFNKLLESEILNKTNKKTIIDSLMQNTTNPFQ